MITMEENKSKKADKVIRKYAFMAASSSLIPGKTLDPVADSLIQYKLIDELREIYEIETKLPFRDFIAVIIDNLAWGKIGSKILGIVGAIYSGPYAAVAAQASWDFVTTLTIGFTFKTIFRTAYENDVEPNFAELSKLVSEGLAKALTYLRGNLLEILGLGTIKLEKYDLEVDKVVNEMEDDLKQRGVEVKKWSKAVKASMRDLIELAKTTKAYEISTKEWVQKLNNPSLNLIKAELNLKKAEGEDVEFLLGYIEEIQN